MAAKKKTPQTTGSESSPLIGYFCTVDENGQAPDCKLPTSQAVWSVADQMDLDDRPRAQKRTRIYKQYKRFSPSSYTNLAKNMSGIQSNVNWGQLEWKINNRKSSFINMLTERNQCCIITTKHGEAHERVAYSKAISQAFDKVMREWSGHISNGERHIQDMLLFDIGVGYWDKPSSWMPSALARRDIIFPEDTDPDLCNLEQVLIRKKYKPVQLWEMVKNEDSARKMGWNRKAVLATLMYHTGTASNISSDLSLEDWAHKVSANDIPIGQYINQTVYCYEMLIKEYDGTISRAIILRDFSAFEKGVSVSSIRNKKTIRGQVNEELGFLYFKKQAYASWEEAIYIIKCQGGDDNLNDYRGHGESNFVQCRQYDLDMNAIITANRVNMMLMVQGNSNDSLEQMKKIEWGPYMTIPYGLEFAQNRFQIPVGEAVGVMQMYMADLSRGTGEYQMNAEGKSGGQRTLGEAEMDAAESAKLTSVEVRQFNIALTLYYKQLVKKFLKANSNSDGYEYVKKFKAICKDSGVPEEAYKWDNIAMVASPILQGAGSPSLQLMASEKTIELCGITAANEGQEMAVRDALAVLNGRENVDAYRPIAPPMEIELHRLIGMENTAMSTPNPNPENAMVYPNDKHLEHLQGHFSDTMAQVQRVSSEMDNMKREWTFFLDNLTEIEAKVQHANVHLQYLNMDRGKQEQFKVISANYAQVQRFISELAKNTQRMMEAESGGEASEKEREAQIKLQQMQAEGSLKISMEQARGNIKLANIAQQHEIRQEIAKDKAATNLAIKRLEAGMRARTKQNQPTKDNENPNNKAEGSAG